MVQLSKDLTWQLIKGHNAFQRKLSPDGKIFSAEPGNLTNSHCPKWSGLIEPVVITPFKKGSGIEVKVQQRGTLRNKPAKALMTRAFKSGPRVAHRRLINLLGTRGLARFIDVARTRLTKTYKTGKLAKPVKRTHYLKGKPVKKTTKQVAEKK